VRLKSRLIAVAVVFGLITSLAATGALAAKTPATRSKASGIALARQALRAATAVPKFVAPGPPFNARAAMKGKTIFNVSIGTQDEFIQVIEGVEQQIAKKVGFNFVSWANTGTPEQWSRGVQTAINEHASLIDLLGLNPEQIAPAVAAAVKAGIPVVSTDAYDLSQKPPASLHLSAYVGIPYAKAGRLMADWTTVATGGKANALVIGSPEVVASAAQVGAIRSEFARVCPGCKVDYTGITIANWASQIEPTVEGAIRSNPSLNYVLPIYDSASQFVIPAITTEGATGRVHIATYDGTPFVLKDLESKTVVTMDVGQDLAWLAYAFIDQDMRVLAKQPPVTNENLPLRVFTSANVKDTGVPPRNSTGYGKAYIPGYYKLWKV